MKTSNLKFLLTINFILSFLPTYLSSSHNLRSLYSEKSKIIIDYIGEGNPKIINENFEDKPDIIYFNGSNYTIDNIKSLQLENGTKQFILVWNHNLTNCSKMFKDSANISKIEFSDFETSEVSDMSELFDGCNNLVSLNLSNFETSKVTNVSKMFKGCSKILSLNLNSFKTSKVIDMSEMFNGCINLLSINLNNFDTSKVKNMNFMFGLCSSITSLDLSNFNTSQVTDMSRIFYDCSQITSFDLSNFDTSQVTNMDSLFFNCLSLKSLDLSNFNTSQVINMNSLFSNCKSLEYLNISNFNTSQVINMNSIFYECENLNSLNISVFNTSQVTDMTRMFGSCLKITSLNISNLDTSKVTQMNGMFFNCESLTSLNVSNFDTSQVIEMYYLFYNCKSLKSLDVSNFNTSKVINMVGMFSDCYNLSELNLSNFDTSNVDYIDFIFTNCPSLILLDISNFNLTNSYSNDMFDFLDQLEYINIYSIKGNLPIINKSVTYCIGDVSNKEEIIANLSKTNSTYDCSNNCFQESSILNPDEKKCFLNCKMIDKFFNYEQTNCINQIPDGFYLNNSELNTIDKCYSKCKSCNKSEYGNEQNCIECILNYTFIKDSIYQNNCYEICEKYYYFDSLNEYHCCNECPTNYKLVPEKNKCINNCSNDDTYKYEYNNKCIIIQYKIPYLFLFVDNYIQNKNEFSFFIYFYIYDKLYYSNTLTFTINLLDLGLLNNKVSEKVNCFFIQNNNNIIKYNCSGNINGTLINITPNYDFDFNQDSSLYINDFGNYSLYNLQKQTGNKYSNAEIIVLNNSILSSHNQGFIIEGKINELKYDFDNITLKMLDDTTGLEKKFNCTSINKDKNKYQINCQTKDLFTGRINNTLGEIQELNDKYLLIIIDDGNNDFLNKTNQNGTEEEIKKIKKYIYIKKSSSGLSVGAIVAIIISCIVILFIATIFRIIYHKKQLKMHKYTQSNESESGFNIKKNDKVSI